MAVAITRSSVRISDNCRRTARATTARRSWRFSGENLIRNRDLVARLASIAHRLGRTVPELAIAWEASHGEDIVPVIGMRKRSRLDAAVRAASVTLTVEDLGEVDAAVPAGAAASERCAAARFASPDSER